MTIFLKHKIFYLSISKPRYIRGKIKVDSLPRAFQCKTTYQQSCQQDVGENGCYVHHLHSIQTKTKRMSEMSCVTVNAKCINSSKNGHQLLTCLQQQYELEDGCNIPHRKQIHVVMVNNVYMYST